MDVTIEILVYLNFKYFHVIYRSMSQIQKIISGGQTGVDQAALNVAGPSEKTEPGIVELVYIFLMQQAT